MPGDDHRTGRDFRQASVPARTAPDIGPAISGTIDLGNNESLVYGVFPNQDGTFTAMTYTKSKTFKTEAGARRWLERNSGE